LNTLAKRDRLHLIMDAAVDDSLNVEDPWLDYEFVEQLPQMDARRGAFTRKLTALARVVLVIKRFPKGLNIFYQRQLPDGLVLIK